MKNIAFLSILMVIGCLNVNAQVNDTIPVTDGFYQLTKNANNKPFALAKPNDVDVKFYKRIWRDIDVKDPENEIFITPGNTLIESIVDGLKKGVVSAYDPSDDSFKKKFTTNQALSKLTDSVLVPKFDADGNQISSSMKLNDFNPENITKYRIKEDIFYNKQRGMIETRIIGIAPLKKISGSENDEISLGDQPAFWLYFPQARYLLVNMDVTDPDKGIYDLSMDDIFIQRKFKSRIVRESKPNGERISDYTKSAEEADKESARIEEKIKNYKDGIWAYPANPKIKNDIKVETKKTERKSKTSNKKNHED